MSVLPVVEVERPVQPTDQTAEVEIDLATIHLLSVSIQQQLSHRSESTA
jgi:hypothetical protein